MGKDSTFDSCCPVLGHPTVSALSSAICKVLSPDAVHVTLTGLTLHEGTMHVVLNWFI